MATRPSVSVIMATYNMGKYLPLAVQSVLSQTYPHLELHVVDDGSTDNTPEQIKQFHGDSRFFYHYQANHGQARAKNAGILRAKGDFIAFLDADDMWFPDKLEKQLPLFDNRSQVGVVYSTHVCIDTAGNPIPTTCPTPHRGRISAFLLVENCVGFNTSVVRRECFETLGLFDESLPMGIDYDLWLRFSTVYEFDYLERPTTYYRVWDGQMSRNTLRRFECGIRIMQRFLQDHPGLVPAPAVRKAWAHTFTGRGNYWANEGARLAAMKDYLRALSYKRTYVPAFKGMIKVILGL